jgi:transcription elongation factor Elf1
MELQAPSEPREVGSTSVKNHTILGPMEHTFTCPSCGEEISMVLDLSVRRPTYIEDCEVCCTPVEISYTVQDDALASFDAKTLE